MCLFCTSSTTNRLFTQIGVMAVNLLGALWSPRRSQTGSRLMRSVGYLSHFCRMHDPLFGRLAIKNLCVCTRSFYGLHVVQIPIISTAGENGRFKTQSSFSGNYFALRGRHVVAPKPRDLILYPLIFLGITLAHVLILPLPSRLCLHPPAAVSSTALCYLINL